MERSAILDAAALLHARWRDGGKLKHLPAPLRPQTREDGYAIAGALAQLQDEPCLGWKIAATSAAGQAHIGVDGPLAGRLYASRVLPPGAEIALDHNLLRVTEVEFAFRFGRELRARDRDYPLSEVMDAIESLHLSLEIPDSRYSDFAAVGAPSLIADTACADRLVLGPPVEAPWREIDFPAYGVRALRNGVEVARGKGAAVLGDPRVALAWLVNEVCRHCGGLDSGAVVTTGTCVVPVPIAPGDAFVGDYGALGTLEVRFRP
jgi:2-keto-4-pentenoate hydratase